MGLSVKVVTDMSTRKKYVITGALVFIIIVCGVFNHNLNSIADTKEVSLNGAYRLDNTNATVTKTLKDLEEAFRDSSLNYKKIEISYETEALNYDIYEQQWNVVNKQIEDINTIINEYTIKKNEFIKAGDTENAQLCQAYIDQYSSELESLKLKQIDTNLNKGIYQFYKDYKTNLIREAQKNLEIDFKKKCLSLVTLNEQIEYYRATEQYLKALVTIERTKYKKGYSTKTVVDDLEAQFANTSVQLIQLKNMYNQRLSDIKVETSLFENFNINFEIEVMKNEYTYETLSSVFASRNYDIIRLNKLGEQYQEYLQQLKEVYGTSSPFISQNELKIREINLDAQISNNKINAMALEAADSYNGTYMEMKAKEQSVAVANQKLKDIAKQYVKGKVAQIDLLKIEMECAQMEAEYYQLYCDFIIWDEVITNIVPGQRP